MGTAGAALVLVLALAGCAKDQAAEPQASPRPGAPSTTTSAPSSTSSTTVVGGEGPSDAGRGPVVDQWRVLLGSDAPQAEVWALLSDPVNSDLDPAEAGTAAATARAVMLADATGVGRDAFPGYWPAPGTARSEACCPQASVAAAGAGRGPAPGVAEALVVWRRQPGAPPEVTSVLLRRTGRGWAPVHPWQL